MVEARSVWSESSPRHEERGTEVRKHQSISGGPIGLTRRIAGKV
jgi:hypothetical protein